MHGVADNVTGAVEQAVRELAIANRRASDLLVLFDTLFSGCAIGFGCWDRNLRCLRINNCLVAIGGSSSDRCEGRLLAEVLPNLSRPLEPLCRAVLGSGTPQHGVEVNEDVPAGTHGRCWLVSVYPTTITKAKKAIPAVALTETTILQDREERVAQARDAAITAEHQAQAVSAHKDQRLAWVTHELRRPLTPVLMELSLLLEDPATGNALRESLEMMVRNLSLQAKLIEDLVDLTRLNQSKIELRLEDVNMHDLIRQSAEISAAEAKARKVAISLDLTAGASHVHGDPRRLLQVLWNLLNNAIKFTPGGGTIWIRTRNVSEIDPQHPVLLVEVQDTGKGIEPADVEKVFRPFEQAGASGEQRSRGMGLGLTLSRALAELHGGKLTASSAGKDRGSTFRLTLQAVPT